MVSRELLCQCVTSTLLDSQLERSVLLWPRVADALVVQLRYVTKLVSFLKWWRLYDNGSRHPPTRWIGERCFFTAFPSLQQPTVVVVGGGAIGVKVVKTLRSFLPSYAIAVITRRPSTLMHLVSEGVHVSKGPNPWLQRAEIVLFCIHTSQLSTAISQLRPSIPQGAVVVATCCGVSEARLSAELQRHCCICDVNTEALRKKWDSEDPVNASCFPSQPARFINMVAAALVEGVTQVGVGREDAMRAVWTALTSPTITSSWCAVAAGNVPSKDDPLSNITVATYALNVTVGKLMEAVQKTFFAICGT